VIGVLLAVVSSVGFGTNIFFARLGLQHMKSSSGVVISSIVAFTLVMIPALALYWKDVSGLTLVAFGWLALVGSLHFGVGRLLNLTGVTLSGASRQSVLLATVPLFSSFFAITIGSERLTVPVILGTLAITSGLIVASRGRTSKADKTNKALNRAILLGNVMGLATAALYGFCVFLENRVVKEMVSPLVASAFALMFGALFVTLLFNQSAARDILRAPKKSWLFMALSGVGIAWGLTFMFFALNRSQVVLVSPLLNISSLITLGMSYLFLRQLEKVTVWLVIGSLMVIAGAAAITIGAA